MDEVVFTPDFRKIGQITRELSSGFYPEGVVWVKLHFGEPGNEKALFPDDIAPVIEALKVSGLEPRLIDTPVAYPSPRGTVEGYEGVVREKGFDRLAPFTISDDYVEVATKDFAVEVCRELIEGPGVLVISHVKGHACSGFGGAIKNLGMGGVSEISKAQEHGLSKPRFIRECQECGVCEDLCPAGAIRLKSGQAVLDNDACWGCSICQLECPHGCLAPEKAIFDDLLAQGAAAVINNLPEKVLFINLLKNITRYCDCEEEHGGVVAPDVGVLFSGNPVAIDVASVDLLRRQQDRSLFEEITHKDPLLHVNFASEYTGYGPEYCLEEYR